MSPAMIVPSTLPKPPMITMANALTITEAPANGVSTSTGPSMAPPMPASAEAITKVSMISRFGLMPMRPAVSRSWATARSALPARAGAPGPRRPAPRPIAEECVFEEGGGEAGGRRRHEDDQQALHGEEH